VDLGTIPRLETVATAAATRRPLHSALRHRIVVYLPSSGEDPETDVENSRAAVRDFVIFKGTDLELDIAAMDLPVMIDPVLIGHLTEVDVLHHIPRADQISVLERFRSDHSRPPRRRATTGCGIYWQPGRYFPRQRS
jgi:hypothetical protein